MEQILGQITENVIKGNAAEVEKLVNQAIKQGIDAKSIMEGSFITGLNVVGEKFEKGEFFLPEMLMAGMAAKAGLQIIKPLLTESKVKPLGVMVIGTVFGDVHDIGKNIVSMMCEGGGFNVVDLGVDVAAEKFIEAAIKNKADIVALSALLSTTRDNMRSIIQAIRSSEPNKNIKIIVGGAPVTQDFSDTIGADGYAADAPMALKKATELCSTVETAK